MSKEIQYFRFTPQEWQNGDISLCDYDLKGLFIDICSFYWVRDCSITLAMLKQKFSNATKKIEKLVELGILRFDDEKSEYISINFLNEQLDVLSLLRMKRQSAGSLGGRQKSSNATILLQQNCSYKDKDNDKDNILIPNSVFSISDKKEKFKTEVDEYSEIYGADILVQFFDYWSELNKVGTKMRYELEKTWDLELRLKRWSSNNFNKNNKNGTNNNNEKPVKINW